MIVALDPLYTSIYLIIGLALVFYFASLLGEIKEISLADVFVALAVVVYWPISLVSLFLFKIVEDYPPTKIVLWRKKKIKKKVEHENY